MVKLLPEWLRRSPLLQVTSFTLIGLVLFGLTKELLAPELTKWGSHSLTIAFGTLVATLGGAIVLSRLQRLHQQVLLLEATSRWPCAYCRNSVAMSTSSATARRP